MDAILQGLKTAVDTLGASVLLPLFIFIFALVLGAKPGRAFRSAVTIGVAFVGINLVIGLMWGALSGVSQALVQNTGIQMSIVDVGWPAAAAVAFATKVGLAVIPVALIVNIALLLTRVTKTLNVDVWNFWHYAFLGSLVTAVTGNLWMGLVAAGIGAAFMLLLADWTGRAVQEFYELPGISIPHGMTAPLSVIGIPINWVIERIPGLRSLKADTEGIERKLGPTFGDPMILGLMIGAALGLFAYFREFSTAGFIPTLAKILVLGIQMAAVMVLLPRMVRILMEGLIPVSEAARTFMAKRASGREIYIGLDSAVLVGHPANISAGLLLVPIAIILMLILPGNRMLLFADLAVLVFLCTQFAPAAKGNVVRMVIIGTVLLIVGFYVSNALAPTITTVALDAGFKVPENAVNAPYISSIADGFVWTPLAFLSAGKYLGWFGMLLFAVITGVGFFLFKRNEEMWEVFAGAERREKPAVAQEPSARPPAKPAIG
jgi:PTS system galactitol-specific IIC component